MTPLPGIAAIMIVLALLAAAGGRKKDGAAQNNTPDTAAIARLGIASLLVQAVLAAGVSWLFPDWHPLPTALAAILSTALVPAMLQMRHGGHSHSLRALLQPLVGASLMTLAAALLYGLLPVSAPLHWLLSGCVLAWVFSIGLPAQAALSRQLESGHVPANMRGFPLRLLGGAVLALALAGMLPPW